MNQELIFKNRLNLLSENLFNKILERMEISIHYQSSSFNITSKFFKNMVCCLYKLNLFVGTNFEKSNNNQNMIDNQPTLTNNVIIDNTNISNDNKNENNIQNLNNQNINMNNKNSKNNNNSNKQDENDKNKGNLNFNMKRIKIGKFQIMKLFYILEKCLENDLEFCKNILNSIRYLLKVASVQLEVYNDPNFHSQLSKLCSHQDFNLNKIAWKTFYQMIIVNSKLTSILVKNELKLYINNLNTNLTNSSNGLHYLNKVFTMTTSEKFRRQVLALPSRRKNQKNSIHSMKKDQKKLIDTLVKRHFVLRFNLLVKKTIQEFFDIQANKIVFSLEKNPGMPFVKLAQVYYNIAFDKQNSKILSYIKKNKEYYTPFQFIIANFPKDKNVTKFISQLKQKKIFFPYEKNLDQLTKLNNRIFLFVLEEKSIFTES